jgi:peptidoglycan/xylan/chitin deacetylase (PgdA/CDA1 family)
VTAKSCAVLAFHKIGEPPPSGWQTWNYIPERVFAGFLAVLAAEGFTVVDLQTFVAGLADCRRLPDRSALLTFDDGCRSMSTTALPLLQRAGHPAVLFVPTDFVGGTNTFDGGAEPEEPICTWQELRELAARGVSIQAHSVTHRSFGDLRADEQRSELLGSKRAIEDAIAQEVTAFAYPFGHCGADPAATAALARETGYRAAFAYLGGVQAMPPGQPFAIARVPMGPDTDLVAALRRSDV